MVETASSWREIRILSFRRSGGERRLFCFHFQWSNLTLFVDFTSIMTTFPEVRDILAVACFEDIIDEYEFLLLWDLHKSKNLDFPNEDYGRFDLDEIDDSECLAEFRVKKRDLPDPSAALQIPNQFVCQRSVADEMEGFCMLSFACHLSSSLTPQM